MFNLFKSKNKLIEEPKCIKVNKYTLNIVYGDGAGITSSGYNRKSLEDTAKKLDDQLRSDDEIISLFPEGIILRKQDFIRAIITNKLEEVTKEKYDEIFGEKDEESASSSSEECDRIGGCLKKNLNDPTASCKCDPQEKGKV